MLNYFTRAAQSQYLNYLRSKRHELNYEKDLPERSKVMIFTKKLLDNVLDKNIPLQ